MPSEGHPLVCPEHGGALVVDQLDRVSALLRPRLLQFRVRRTRYMDTTKPTQHKPPPSRTNTHKMDPGDSLSREPERVIGALR